MNRPPNPDEAIAAGRPEVRTDEPLTIAMPIRGRLMVLLIPLALGLVAAFLAAMSAFMRSWSWIDIGALGGSALMLLGTCAFWIGHSCRSLATQADLGSDFW